MIVKQEPVRHEGSVVRREYKGGEGSEFVSARAASGGWFFPPIPKLQLRVSPVAKGAIANPTKRWREFSAGYLGDCMYLALESLLKYQKNGLQSDLDDYQRYTKMVHGTRQSEFLSFIRKKFDEEIHRAHGPH